jgi:hypothetical protein
MKSKLRPSPSVYIPPVEVSVLGIQRTATKLWDLQNLPAHDASLLFHGSIDRGYGNPDRSHRPNFCSALSRSRRHDHIQVASVPFHRSLPMTDVALGSVVG